MLKEEFKKINCSEKNIMNFGAVLSFAFAAFALLFYFKNTNWFWYFLAALILLNGILIIKPAALTIIYKNWMRLAVIIGVFMTKILLGIFFFVCILPIAMLKKWDKKKSMELNFNKELKTYWIKKYAGRNPRKQY